MPNIEQSVPEVIQRERDQAKGKVAALLHLLKDEVELIQNMSEDELREFRRIVKSNPTLRQTVGRLGVMYRTDMRFRRRALMANDFRQTRMVREPLSISLSVHSSQSPKSYPEYLSSRTVSKILGISPQMVRRYCQEGRIVANRTLGDYGEWRIDAAQFRDNPQYAHRYEAVISEGIRKTTRVADVVSELSEDATYHSVLNNIDANRRVERGVRD